MKWHGCCCRACKAGRLRHGGNAIGCSSMATSAEPGTCQQAVVCAGGEASKSIGDSCRAAGGQFKLGESSPRQLGDLRAALQVSRRMHAEETRRHRGRSSSKAAAACHFSLQLHATTRIAFRGHPACAEQQAAAHLGRRPAAQHSRSAAWSAAEKQGCLVERGPSHAPHGFVCPGNALL